MIKIIHDKELILPQKYFLILLNKLTIFTKTVLSFETDLGTFCASLFRTFYYKY